MYWRLSTAPFRPFFLGPGDLAAAAMRGRLRVIDEPRLRPDSGGDPQGFELRVGERLEMVGDGGFVDPVEMLQCEGLEQESVTAELGRKTGDGGGSTVERASDLAVRGATVETGRDLSLEAGPLGIVRAGKRLLGTCATAGFA